MTLKNGVYHEDVGVGMSEMPKKGIAIELAKKEAVSDARKRALRLFGNYLGNSLCDGNYVRQLDTNHKDVDLNPLTFNSIRQRNKDVFESEMGLAMSLNPSSFVEMQNGMSGVSGIQGNGGNGSSGSNQGNETQVNDVSVVKNGEDKKELAEDTFGDDIFDLL